MRMDNGFYYVYESLISQLFGFHWKDGWAPTSKQLFMPEILVLNKLGFKTQVRFYAGYGYLKLSLNQDIEFICNADCWGLFSVDAVTSLVICIVPILYSHKTSLYVPDDSFVNSDLQHNPMCVYWEVIPTEDFNLSHSIDALLGTFMGFYL